MMFLPNVVLICIFFKCVSFVVSSIEEEPKCHSKFEYDFQLVQKLVALDNQQRGLQETIIEQQTTITALKEKIEALPWWGDWASWSQCYSDCSGVHSGRIQNRTRSTMPASGNKVSETESRPCNAVQFAGCVKSSGKDDNFGVIFDFKDQLAQATCTAILSTGGYVNAVRRLCSSSAPDCNTICEGVGRKCFNALHVYSPQEILQRNEVGKKGLQMYKYNGCTGNFCGPNFCCCT